MATPVDYRSEALSAFAEQLRAALTCANLPTLLLVLHTLTGNDRWLEEPYVPTAARGLDDHDDAGLPVELQEEVRAAAFEVVLGWKAGELRAGDPPDPQRLADLLSHSLAEPVPHEYGGLLAEEMGITSRAVDIDENIDRTRFDVLVIGAGMAGINIGVMLKAAGIPFTIVEKNHDVGGTWLENTYPGCGVDTPSHLYSFSFAKSSSWRGYFGERDELYTYFRRLVDEHDLASHIEFGTEVERAEWDAEQLRWRLEVVDTAGKRRSLTSRMLVSAVGHFNRPSIPEIPGIESFPGQVVHTAQWRPDIDLDGKRVAVVGSGASAMQVVPAVAERVASLVVFQRSRQWVVPHPNCGRPVAPEVQWLLEHVPYYAGYYRLRQFWRFGDRLHPALQVEPDYPDGDFAVNEVNAAHRRFLTSYIERELAGRPDLIEASVPDYPAYGKRPLIDHGWYRTIRRDDVELVDGGLARIEGSRLVGTDGSEHDVDVLVLATGFKTLQMLGPMEVDGRDGTRLREIWGEDDARAYLGMTVPGFPNFFMLFGPNTSTGHGGSAFLTTEMQVRYVMQIIKHQLESGTPALEVRPDVHDAYNAEVDDALSRTVWTHPRVNNYYRNRSGRIVGTSPWEYVEYWRRTNEADIDAYAAPVDGSGSGA